MAQENKQRDSFGLVAEGWGKLSMALGHDTAFATHRPHRLEKHHRQASWEFPPGNTANPSGNSRDRGSFYRCLFAPNCFNSFSSVRPVVRPDLLLIRSEKI
jgi:hypothetical protein